MYVLKLMAIIVGALLGLIIIFFITLRIYVWRKERRYDQNDLSQKESRSHHLMLIGEFPWSILSSLRKISICTWMRYSDIISISTLLHRVCCIVLLMLYFIALCHNILH